jgi:hypothetical protein
MVNYIGIKKIKAEPMTRGDYNKFRGWNIPENENPNDKGYIVKYSDGYISWSPKSVFEEAYDEIGNKPLIDTVVLMKSNDYKERFIAEYQQLVIRYKGLKKMLDNLDKGELSFVPACLRSTYNMQIKSMADYIAVLEARAVMEGIDLWEV